MYLCIFRRRDETRRWGDLKKPFCWKGKGWTNPVSIMPVIIKNKQTHSSVLPSLQGQFSFNPSKTTPVSRQDSGIVSPSC